MVNKGGSEEKSSTTLERFEENVINAGAEYVLINAGFCEIHTAVHQGRELEPVFNAILGNKRRMVAKSKQHNIKPILTTLTPVRPRFLLPHTKKLDYASKNKKEENDALREFNEQLRRYCVERGIGLIDFHKALADNNGQLNKRYSLADGEHLNHGGYKVTGSVFESGSIRNSIDCWQRGMWCKA